MGDFSFEEREFFKIKVTVPWTNEVQTFELSSKYTVDRVKTLIFSKIDSLNALPPSAFFIGLSAEDKCEIEFFRFVQCRRSIEDLWNAGETIEVTLFPKLLKKDSISLSTTHIIQPSTLPQKKTISLTQSDSPRTRRLRAQSTLPRHNDLDDSKQRSPSQSSTTSPVNIPTSSTKQEQNDQDNFQLSPPKSPSKSPEMAPKSPKITSGRALLRMAVANSSGSPTNLSKRPANFNTPPAFQIAQLIELTTSSGRQRSSSFGGSQQRPSPADFGNEFRLVSNASMPSMIDPKQGLPLPSQNSTPTKKTTSNDTTTTSISNATIKIDEAQEELPATRERRSQIISEVDRFKIKLQENRKSSISGVLDDFEKLIVEAESPQSLKETVSSPELGRSISSLSTATIPKPELARAVTDSLLIQKVSQVVNNNNNNNNSNSTTPMSTSPASPGPQPPGRHLSISQKASKFLGMNDGPSANNNTSSSQSKEREKILEKRASSDDVLVDSEKDKKRLSLKDSLRKSKSTVAKLFGSDVKERAIREGLLDESTFDQFDDTKIVAPSMKAIEDAHFPPLKVLWNPCAGFTIETPIVAAFGLQFNAVRVESYEFDTPHYSNDFFGKQHINIIAYDQKNDPVIISAIQKSNSNQVWCLSRSRGGQERKNIDVSLKGTMRKKPPTADIVAAINPSLTNYRRIKDSSIQKDLESFENSLVVKNYKFGILYCGPNQTNEEDMFSNVKGSDDYEDFLTMLGDRIQLKGWKYYRAGLDVKNNTTGSMSVYTKFRKYEIMFHVSTLLPLMTNRQQLERKRHLGNNIVLLVFKDGDTPLSPNFLKSEYIHVYIIVERVKNPNTTDVYYRVSVARKDGVPAFDPQIPDPPLFPAGEYFRNWLLIKMINAERASYAADVFKQKIERTRITLLQDVDSTYKDGEK